LVTAGKHVNNNRAVARQPPITTIEELLEAVFSVESAPRLYNEEPVWWRDSWVETAATRPLVREVAP
jgi:hypothetical protein